MKLADKIKFTKENIALILIVILSSILNFMNLSIEGYGNSYYVAAVKSMTMNLKNFFFVSFDPAGFVSIDKPPLGFWIQAICAKIFGFSGVSIILPQALAGVICVILIYFIVKRAFGRMAGLISALCLAVTAVFVAASRNNTIYDMLVIVLLLSCFALSVAAEKGKFKYFIISMALVGIGITSMWEFYKERNWKSWLLPAALLVNGGIQLLIASYLTSYSSIVKMIMICIAVLCIIPSIIDEKNSGRNINCRAYPIKFRRTHVMYKDKTAILDWVLPFPRK